MTISRSDQARFAEIIVPLAEQIADPDTLSRLHKLSALVLELSGFEDNGIAFDVSEYTFELQELADGKKPDGWSSHAKTSLEQQLNELNRP